jgi:ABC-2 type transport system ATP-binding protein
MPVLSTYNLSKKFFIKKTAPGFLGALSGLFSNKKTIVNAVRDVSFSVEKGEVVGLIGPNGAGKSTTVKMITGILFPTSGKISLFGNDPIKNRLECSLKYGVVFGQRSQLWWHLPLSESFHILEAIYRLDKHHAKQTREKLIELFELNDILHTPVRQLSLGQRTKANIAASLLHEPEILFLDEPTIGVEVVGKTRLRDFINRVNKELQVTIIITSHDMVDIERLCKRVIIIDHGKIMYDGQLATLREKVVRERKLSGGYCSPSRPVS